MLSNGKEFSIQDGNNLIGRWDPQDKSFPEIDLEEDDVDAKVSRRHCVIEKTGDKAILEDIGSLNGTFVNAVKVEQGQKAELQSGDEVIIGKIKLRFEA